MVFHLVLPVTLELCGWAESCWILGKYYTRIPLAHNQFCPKLCILVNFWTTSICLPMHNLLVTSRSSFQDTIQNLKIRWSLCARDWWLVHSQSKTLLPWKVFPINCFHSVDLIWLFGHQFFRHVEHLFQCEIFSCILDGMPIVWVSLSHEYGCFPCWRHKHFPYHKPVCRCLSLHLSRIDSVSFALDHSPCVKMIWILTTFLILRRCKNLSYRYCTNKTSRPVLSSNNSSDYHSWEDQVLPTFHSE